MISSKLRPLLLGLAVLLSLTSITTLFAPSGCAADPVDAVKKASEPVFPLQYCIVDPDNADNADKQPGEKKLPPLIVMFPKGQTHDDKDATGPIGRLEAFRGKSKLIPDSNDNPGLPVFLCGLRFLERKDAAGKVVGYDVELQGEFNAVKVPATDEAMASFLDNKPTTFALESRLNYGIIATVSTTKLQIQRSGDKIYILSVEGDFSFRETIFTYKSSTLKLSPPSNRKYLFYGESGELPTLRIL
jgi:hypothetical protein